MAAAGACSADHGRDGAARNRRSAARSALEPARGDSGDVDPDGGALELPRVLTGPLAACVRRVEAATPPELAGVLASLTYPSIAEDGCRLSFAVSARDPTLCDDVALSAVRETCRARAAIAVGSPELCPDAHPDRGRDAVCVALASRSVGLCAGASRADSLRCLAMARGDATQCTALDPLLRPRCVADVVALVGVLPRSHAPPFPPARIHLRISTLNASNDAGVTLAETDLTAQSRGAVLDTSGVLWLIDPGLGWPGEFAHLMTSGEPIVGVAIPLPARPGRAFASDVRVVSHDGAVYDARAGAIAGDVQMTAVPHGRGGHAEGTVSATLYVTGQPVRVEIAFSTFVRDVVAPDVVGHP